MEMEDPIVLQEPFTYLQPGLSSLLSRGSYDMKRVEAEEIRRTDPDLYRRQVKEGYLRGVEEDPSCRDQRQHVLLLRSQ